MVICGIYMFEFSVGKDMKKNCKSSEIHALNEGRDGREGRGTFMFSTKCQGIEISDPTLNIIFGVVVAT